MSNKFVLHNKKNRFSKITAILKKLLNTFANFAYIKIIKVAMNSMRIKKSILKY